MTKTSFYALCCLCLGLATQGFVPTTTRNKAPPRRPCNNKPTTTTPWLPLLPPTTQQQSSSRLYLLLDVPDGFFTVTFFMSGILLSLSKNFARIRMEENAWEQRLAGARVATLRANPTLTEGDLRRQEAALEWSAYGKPRFEEEQAAAASRGRRVQVKERQQDDNEDENDYDRATPRMTDDEINSFELEYGVSYDPYYDEPYTQDELPTDINYQTDRRYGDRIYENGEIFYKHEDLYYRQGAKPRNLKFWD